jgi:hypothetical protein
MDGCRVEWEAFTLMVFLNPFCQWMWSHTCSDEDFIHISDYLEVLVTKEMQNEEI